MKSMLAIAIAFVLILPGPSAAHRLDEYLQASRLSVTRDGIAVEIDLTPGASMAARVGALVDTDADGRFAPLEAEVYGRGVLADLILEVDGHAVPLRLVRVEIPALVEMADGVGTIRLTAVGDLPPITGSRLHVRYRNDHQADSSVYLVNALVPDSREIAVAAQTRDPQQHEIRLEYDVSRGWPAQLAWLLSGAVGLAGLVVLRRG